MKALDFSFRCDENWEQMQPSSTGRHCQACDKIVIDFTKMTTEQIQQTLIQHKDNDLCGRMKNSQIEQINRDYDLWLAQRQRNPQLLFFTALILSFGLSLFSCSNQSETHQLLQAQKIAKEIQIKTDEDSVPKKPHSVRADKIEKIEVAPEIDIEPTIATIEQDTVVLDNVVIYEDVEYESFTMGLIVHTVPKDAYISTETAYDDQGREIPKVFEAKAFPNPTANTCTLEIKLPTTENSVIRVFDMSGRFITMLHEGELKRGIHEFSLDLREQPSGMYLIQFSSKSTQETIRVIKN